jgi:hypothetical protein
MKEQRKHVIKSREQLIERRKQTRYTTPLRVKLEIMTASGKHILHVFTSNVCSGGVLCDTDKIVPIGSEVRVSLLVESEGVKKTMGARTLVKVKGRVARFDPGGMAIRFYKEYTIKKIVDPDWQLQ